MTCKNGPSEKFNSSRDWNCQNCPSNFYMLYAGGSDKYAGLECCNKNTFSVVMLGNCVL
jgi:hypothetical protein